MQNLTGKKKPIERYYDEEMWYLNEAGKEFARLHPERARFLNIDQLDDRDPYVERLFEGFAFLAGRVREKLDDELPELTRSLLGLLWPHFLRPIPSLSILEFQPIPGRAQEPRIIERGAEVVSQPVHGMYICRFRSCYDVHVRPITLSEVTLERQGTGSAIRFRFQVDDGVNYSSLFNMEGGTQYQRYCRRSIRLYIHEVDQPTASLLYLFLNQFVREVFIQPITTRSTGANSVRGEIRPVGFSAEEGLFPYSNYSFSGYRLLQEYFAYPRKFLFFDILGFERIQFPDDADGFEAQILFDRIFPIDRQFGQTGFRLHCTPIVNLSHAEAHPISVNHESTEYRVRSSTDGYEVYSVDAVEGTVISTGKRRTYMPFYSFKHSLSDSDTGIEHPSCYYHTSTRLNTRSIGEGRTEDYQETYVSIVNPDLEVDELREETLSISITCTSGTLGREPKIGEICNPTSESQIPGHVRFRNLAQPTLILYPPLRESLEWRFISHLALNYLSLNNAEALRGILELYNWSREMGVREANRRRIASIMSVNARPRELPYRGSILRGIEVTLEIAADNFEDPGDIYLFGSVIKEFLELYVSINSFVYLRFLSYQTKEELFEWPPEVMNDRNREFLMQRRHLPL